MGTTNKRYEKYFVLEPTKVTRLVEIIHERLADHSDVTTHDVFTVFQSGGRKDDLKHIEEVLALDNSPKYKIERLLITCTASGAAFGDRHQIQVDFPSPHASTTSTAPDGSKKAFVSITVRSDDTRWATRTLSEVEEQVERTWQPYVPPVLVLFSIAFGSLLFVLTLFLPIGNMSALNAMGLNEADLQRMEELVAGNRIISAEEMREVVTRQLRNLVWAQRPQKVTTPRDLRLSLYLGLPLLIVAAVHLRLSQLVIHALCSCGAMG